MIARILRRTGRWVTGATLAVALAAGSSPIAAADGPAADPPGLETQRIEFAPGTDNATRDGTLSPGRTDRWILRARAGQTFAITIDSADNNTIFSVFDPSWRLLANVTAIQAEANTFWTGVLPADGDYAVEVASSGGAAYYQMKVWIDAGHMDPLGLVQRISFAPGTDSGTGYGSVIRASTDSWLLTARAGQTMDVVVEAGPGTGTTFDVYAPDGTLMTAPASRVSWSGQLPADGDYRVAVSPLGGNSDYTVTVRITGGTTPVGDPEYNPGNVSNPNPQPVVLDGGGGTRRISFEPGADHAIISNVLAPGMADTFILGAAAGQQLNAWVESDTSEVTVAAFDPNGEILRTAAFDVYVEQLSSSGDYELEVWNQSSIVSSYTLTVYIT
ncbi:hypothetical protein [Desertimonas flava]|jgi:hypothetical protein|uniref:hypothetical protein n=1 Tax=Desertimonas flava TaxID=2064846 RepID=UPI000E3531AF|nr:hypothetical protein [Desertimonas flava]